MQEISVSIVEKAIYKMCKDANIFLPSKVYTKIEDASNVDEQNKFILKNAQFASQNDIPICQDTGQVIVFMSIGQDVHFLDGNLTNSINQAIKKCYKDNYFRKSVVKDALYDRNNTNDNTPCTIHYDICSGNEVEIKIMIKGGGSENVTGARLLNPTLSKEQVYDEVLDIVKNAGKNACPPLFIGVGLGQTLEQAVLLSKKAVICGNFNNELYNILNKNIKIGFKKPVLDVRFLTSSTHIASMPLGVTILCHANRYNSCKIVNGEIIYTTDLQTPKNIEVNVAGKKVTTKDIKELKMIKTGEKLLLTGTIYTARDQAHKRLVDMIKNNEKLPFDIKNSIIFYAGPCPKKANMQSGVIGPTTAKRMDNFAINLYEAGSFATIAKGTRSDTLAQYLIKTNKKYFEIQGGIASYITNCIKSSKIIAFEEFGAEAIYELEVKDLPLTCIY